MRIIMMILICITLAGCTIRSAPPIPPELTHTVTPTPRHAQEEKISTFMTEMLDKEESRINNVILASRAIDNLVLQPGGEFSFNQVVGARTAERGFQEATILVGTQQSTGIGGGICQVSSTLFQAALGANLEITEHHSHQKPVPYIEEGKDATVASNADFRFRNTLEQPIRIDVTANGGAVTVDIFKV